MADRMIGQSVEMTRRFAEEMEAMRARYSAALQQIDGIAFEQRMFEHERSYRHLAAQHRQRRLTPVRKRAAHAIGEDNVTGEGAAERRHLQVDLAVEQTLVEPVDLLQHVLGISVIVQHLAQQTVKAGRKTVVERVKGTRVSACDTLEQFFLGGFVRTHGGGFRADDGARTRRDEISTPGGATRGRLP